MLAIFLVTFLVQSIYCAATIIPPRITSVTLLHNKAVQITWTFDNITQIGLKKYKILTSSDNWASEYEWPAQVKRVESFKIDDPYCTKETTSSFECFNACIDEARCAYVQRQLIDGVNCFLSDKIVENGTKVPAESGTILDYNENSAIVRDLPLDRLYKFKVSVYDEISKTWSNFSASTAEIDLRLSWTQVNVSLSPNYQEVSRLKWNVYLNQTFLKEIIPSMNSIEAYQPLVNYVNEDYTNPILNITINHCQSLCKFQPSCVQYIFFNEDYRKNSSEIVIAKKNSCFLKSHVDIVNGVNVRPEAEAWSIKTLNDDIEIDELEIGGSYTIEVESKTIYGIESNRSRIRYNMTGLAPNINIMVIQSSDLYFSWSMPEALNYTRHAVYYTMNHTDSKTYFLETSTDFIDPNEKTLYHSTLSNCFESCFNNSKCLAFSHTSITCVMKFNLDTPVQCRMSTCAKIPNYKNEIYTKANFYNTDYEFRVYVQTPFGVNSFPSDPRRFTFIASTSVEIIDKFVVRGNARLRCYDNLANIKSINWYKNGVLYEPENDNVEFQYNKSYIYFKNIKQSFSGVYKCEIVFNNGQQLMSNNNAEVAIENTVPSMPNIRSILPVRYGRKNGALIQWDVDFEDLPIVCVNVSRRPMDSNEERDRMRFNETWIEICDDFVRSGYLALNRTFYCRTDISISVKNAIGYSQISGYRSFDLDTCLEYGRVELYMNENYALVFSAIFILLGLTFIFISLTTWMYIKKKKMNKYVENFDSSDKFKMVRKK